MADKLTPEEQAASNVARQKGGQRLTDGLLNIASGLGTSSDKSSHNQWERSRSTNDYDELTVMYREDWISQKICSIVATDMTREWRAFADKPAQIADKKWNARGLTKEALLWSRVYGTSFIVPGLIGTGKLSTPLDRSRVRPGSLKTLQVVDRTRIFPVGGIVTDALSPYYGSPRYFMLGGSNQRIHASRLIRFDAVPLVKYETWKNHYYADSVLTSLKTLIDAFHTAVHSTAQLMQESGADIIQVPGLEDLLTDDEGASAMLQRFQSMKQLMSHYRMILLDAEEAHTTKTVHLTGLKDLLWEWLRVVAAACNVPATRFLNASPDGQNSTGEHDMNTYIDTIRGKQRDMESQLVFLDELIQRSEGLDPYPDYKWNCIFPESLLQKADRVKKVADALVALSGGAAILDPQDAQELLRTTGTLELESFRPPPPPPPLATPTTGGKSANN